MGHCWKGSNVTQPNDNLIVSQVHFTIEMINVNLSPTLIYFIKDDEKSKYSFMLI